jgi:Mrp family chromosome partitioning ATPase
MSKIYEALRRHEQKPTPDEALRPDEPLRDESAFTEDEVLLAAETARQPADLGEHSHAVGNYLGASRPMQTLFRAVEPLVSTVQGGAMIMFSSAHAGEGKTTVCGSYAATLAQNFGKSVLILDADRGHTLTRQWGSPKSATFSALEESSEPAAVLHAGRRMGPSGSISVLPVESASADSPELVLIAHIKDKLAKTFDYILIDAPAVADVSWSPSIGAMTDGVILVVEAERTRWPVALNAKQEFESGGARVVGVFLNKRRFYIPPRIYRRI